LIDVTAVLATGGENSSAPDEVDLVNGGNYEVQAQGEEAQWTICSLELKPKQKN
jgi:hypothetical protein